MSETKQPTMSNAERVIIKVLWDHGSQRICDILPILAKLGKPWTRSTVTAFLQRLEAKQYIISDRRRRAFIYTALVTREDEILRLITKLASEFSDGNIASLMLACTERHRFSSEELLWMQRLIDELQERMKRKGSLPSIGTYPSERSPE